MLCFKSQLVYGNAHSHALPDNSLYPTAGFSTARERIPRLHGEHRRAADIVQPARSLIPLTARISLGIGKVIGQGVDPVKEGGDRDIARDGRWLGEEPGACQGSFVAVALKRAQWYYSKTIRVVKARLAPCAAKALGSGSANSELHDPCDFAIVFTTTNYAKRGYTCQIRPAAVHHKSVYSRCHFGRLKLDSCYAVPVCLSRSHSHSLTIQCVIPNTHRLARDKKRSTAGYRQMLTYLLNQK